MDSSSGPTPAKRRCISMNRSKKQPFEHVRHFQLPQQFPSTMKHTSKNGINIAEFVKPTISPNTMKISNVENQVPHNLHKLRILSPGGRDLGEFKVKRLPANSSKGNTVTITKSNCKPNDKPLILPLSPVMPTKSFPRILKQGSTNFPRRNLMEVMSSSKTVPSKNSTNVLHEQKSITKDKKPLSSQNMKGKVEKQTYEDNINAIEIHYIDQINSKHSVCQTNSNQKYILYYGIDDIDVQNHIKIQETTAENNKISLTIDSSLSNEIIKLPCSVSSKKRTINSSNKNNIPLSEKVSKGKCIATIKKTENGKIVTSLKNATNVVQRCNQTDRNLSQNNSIKSSTKKDTLYDRNKLSEKKSDIVPKAVSKKTQNVMTIIPNNKASMFDQNTTLIQKYKTSSPSESNKQITNTRGRSIHKYNTKCENTQSKDLKAEFQNDKVITNSHMQQISESQQIKDVSANMQSNVQSKNCSKDMSQENLSDQLNIIKKAMDSIRDNELREQALKALANCGIGIERHIPIHPPKDHKAVHDTQVQTVVFGLLDPKSFILINKDSDDVNRINQINFCDMPNDKNLSVNKSHSNNSISKDLNIMEQESLFDLDSFMEQFWKEDSDALKMKETLSMTKVRCNSLLEHLQRDFENVKRYDQNGMLNIHNAVISDNIYLVQRHLMVLQYCKQSVDILTEDGVTSLELAIKYNVCIEIVKLLLDAGAQPVIPKSLHESAMIIASKHSSPLLSILVNQISDPKLLDHIDSEGFAALHYCSMRGNLKGVKVLLSAGATIDLRDMKSGRTPLFHAVDNDCTSVKKALLKAGAVTNIANFAGQTPLCIFNNMRNLSFESSLTKDTTSSSATISSHE